MWWLLIGVHVIYSYLVIAFAYSAMRQASLARAEMRTIAKAMGQWETYISWAP